MASEVLFDRNLFSMSALTLKAACRTSGDRAFHAEVFPAKWVNIGLQNHHKSFITESDEKTGSIQKKFNLRLIVRRSDLVFIQATL